MNRFFTVDEINPGLHLLEQRFHLIKKEFLDNINNLVWTNWGAAAGYHGENNLAYAGWQIAALYAAYEDSTEFTKEMIIDNLPLFEKSYGQKIYPDINKGVILAHNAKHLPVLASTCYEAGIRKRVGISVVFPGKEIKWHIDPDPEVGDNLIVRGLWGLDVRQEDGVECYLGLGPENDFEKRLFEDNKFMFFYGRVPHGVINNLTTPRYALCFDHVIEKSYLESICH
jgi:hypothetical protein